MLADFYTGSLLSLKTMAFVPSVIPICSLRISQRQCYLALLSQTHLLSLVLSPWHRLVPSS